MQALLSLCRELQFFFHAIVAINGSKFKAVNSRDAKVCEGVGITASVPKPVTGELRLRVAPTRAISFTPRRTT